MFFFSFKDLYGLTKESTTEITPNFKEIHTTLLPVLISQKIKQHNDQQLVLNIEKYGPLQNDSVIIIVQVHTRLNYLKHLIASLAQSKGISNTLLIFSHDYYDKDINNLVQAIDFCKVLQVN